MLALISPAKTLDFETPAPTRVASQPAFLADSQELIDVLRKLAPHEISDLMGISDKLGVLNYDRFAQWQPPFHLDNAKQALFAFKGDVYTGLAAESFDAGDIEFAQEHLRILSGLYGLLQPLDLIQPYRLEMGTRLANPRGKDLYQFWGDRITQAINTQLSTFTSPVVINLASNEYFKSVRPRKLEAPVITPVFKDWKNGRYKIISFYAKKARGMMSAYLIKNRLTDAEALKDFGDGGYSYNGELSTATDWVFTRAEA
ncbi:peroxide stress protein YaaA [Marinimicrobium sp. ABcell2]|uniref:peroxide stress protein YaaA n=1 Tax=Marinimicrobium sp. ABcell2 TaxID=3069751 RepID=UPI0027B140F5|nr:peroxide stress protein YaaA [Marinimicrobium sp. ABcell2]MDQ2076949.1 peroxide stress protein YaaA [Marinimicrobium sp. ABcell2]